MFYVQVMMELEQLEQITMPALVDVRNKIINNLESNDE
jgi:hypothetical protein